MIATIFDTNAYIGLVSQKSFDEVRDLIRQLKQVEQSKGYVAYINPTVAMELLSHLLDKHSMCSPSYTYTKACMAMYAHCADKEKNTYNITPLQEVQIANVYWGIENKVALETQKNIAYILSEIEQVPQCRTVRKYRKQLQQIRDFIQEAEVSYIKSIEDVKTFILQENPTYKDWQSYLADKKNRDDVTGYLNSPQLKKLLAKSMIYAIAIDLKNKGLPSPSADQIEKAIDIYLQDAAIPLELQQMILSHFDDSNYKFHLPHRVNMLWDSKILGVVGHKLQGKDEILLVTTDKDMQRAAKTVKSDSLIMSLPEYLKMLDFNI